ncbi:CIC11C00000006011 [Sungouiella intermedia]|uniref:CIC11C00000006011 n=1 Tax=Sungouiella intermedia TaxID=45354 RepID=A0A1L0BDC2_9ASCO|nr:CIC11C00000006011 [[Candida] intermedia]
MLSRTSVARQFVRYASKAEKISVQLLQDYQPLGVAGEVVRVKPAFMRNFLHVGNKACYMVDGPKIPKRDVVSDKPKKKTPDSVLAQEPQAKKESAPALSLDELSSLFTTMRSSKTKKSSVVGFQADTSAGEVAAYSLAELGESLPDTFTLSGKKYPITREQLAQSVFNSTGIEVPSSVIKVVGENGTAVEEIVESGVYSWSFLAAGDANILKKKLRVQ